MTESFASQIIAYHEASKHHYRTYAPGPRNLDWATQPDPFRRYTGAQVVPLTRPEPLGGPPYEAGFTPGLTPAAPLDFASVSRLFFDTLAISAWKKHDDEPWALRVNPSSGNLHPTEGYLICGAVPGLSDVPIVAHYTPAEHALEVRARLTPHIWRSLREGVALNRGDGLPTEAIFVGLTSILWREAWKYGDRAFRYCQHDVGHALGALGVAAAGLGWQTRLLDNLGTEQVGTLLGVADPRGAEAEHPDCLVAVFPQSAHFQQWELPESLLDIFRPLGWQGQPNVLSPSRVEWRWADAGEEITGKPANSELQIADSKWQTADSELQMADSKRQTADSELQMADSELQTADSKLQMADSKRQTADSKLQMADSKRQTADSELQMADSRWQRSVTDDTSDIASAAQSQSASLTLRRIIHQRRSAQEMDCQTAIERDAFYRMLARTLPGPDRFPFALLPRQPLPQQPLPWAPRVHLALFVHRVSGLAPGLYFLVRDAAQVDALAAALKPGFAWEAPTGCPPELPLYRLASGDTRAIARRISCGQDIAADGCFSLGMLAEFERPLNALGAWIYPRLFWECGMIGQVLYLEAEAAGVRGTGIGCFFDDGMHSLLGLRDRQYQDLYHFTVGGPVDDPRLMTLPAYT